MYQKSNAAGGTFNCISSFFAQDRKLKYCCDSVEFCPFPDVFEGVGGSAPRDVFACGNYELDEKTKKKCGALWLFRCDAGARGTSAMQDFQTIETAAIFDIKWCPRRIGSEKRVLLGEAAEDGSLSVYRVAEASLENKKVGPRLERVQRVEVADKGKACLSLDWNAHSADAKSVQVAVSRGDKSVSVFDLGEKGLVQSREFEAHDIDEVWICAFGRCSSTSTLYTGSDDCTLRRWDLRSPARRPAAINESHEAGVTVVAPHPSREGLVATGSYDEKIRIFDARKLVSPLSEFSTGGGVWRLRWNAKEERKNLLLAGCMRAGFRVLSLEASGFRLGAEAEYKAHDSLAYGCDWGVRDSALVASCSFYDKSLHLWRLCRGGAKKDGVPAGATQSAKAKESPKKEKKAGDSSTLEDKPSGTDAAP